MCDVYIARAKQDAEIARILMDAIEHDGKSVFLDDTSLVAGDAVQDSVVEEIASSLAVLPLLPRNSTRSSWVERELRDALEEPKAVIPVLMDEEATNNWVWPLVADRNVIELDLDLNIVELVAQVGNAINQVSFVNNR